MHERVNVIITRKIHRIYTEPSKKSIGKTHREDGGAPLKHTDIKNSWNKKPIMAEKSNFNWLYIKNEICQKSRIKPFSRHDVLLP